MSKFATFDTPALKNEELLLDALRALGYTDAVIERGDDLKMNGWGGERPSAQIVIRKRNIPGANYGDLGFRRTEDGFTLVADDMDIECIHGGRFTAELTKLYNQGVAERVRARVRGGIMRTVQGRTNIIRVRF